MMSRKVFYPEAVFPKFNLVGQKRIYMPHGVVRFIRPEPNESPYYAKFQVPLSWGKLDLKDYLYHAYNVEALRIRSHVYQERAKRYKPDTNPNRSEVQWHRPSSKKYMTIFMRDPFVWPKEPEDFSPWDKDLYEARMKEHHSGYETRDPDADTTLPADAATLRNMAHRLLSGEQKWESGTPSVPLPKKRLWKGDLGR